MEEAISSASRSAESSSPEFPTVSSHGGPKRVSESRPQILTLLTDFGIALSSALFLVLAFPDFQFWPLAWVGLVPLLLITGRRSPSRSFLSGWLMGTVFFYASCHWLTFSMINYGHIAGWLAYLLLVPPALLLGIFPAFFAYTISRLVRSWGHMALLASPIVWTALEWARLEVTGQLWNALGYSQAYQPLLIGSARWGGVYAVGFQIILANVAFALIILRRTRYAVVAAAAILAVVVLLTMMSIPRASDSGAPSNLTAIALQPNVPMDPSETSQQQQQLTERHLTLSEQALKELNDEYTPRLVVWPESPMNFSYASDLRFRSLITNFARQNHTAVLFNSQEPAPADGLYNSAVLINEEGRLVAQYDKIRLMPFGEYVPLPHWLPGASLITGLVGDFTAGTQYTLMPVDGKRVGVFICIESAYPKIARTFSAEGAGLLINISNDGYLGRTAVMRQHLANVIFRAVENARPLLRVTNTGITAFVRSDGHVDEMTRTFEPAVRSWRISSSQTVNTFYTKHGDLFAVSCALLSLLLLTASFIRRRVSLS